MEAGGESRPHKAPPAARSATTDSTGPRPLLIHRRYPCSSLFPRTGPAASSGSGAPPRGMQWTRPERQRRAAGIPGPAHWREEGRRREGPAPGPAPHGPAPSGPAPRPRREGTRAMAAGPLSSQWQWCVFSAQLVTEPTGCSRNHSRQPLRLEKNCQVTETHRNKAFSLKNCKASIYIDSESLPPRL